MTAISTSTAPVQRAHDLLRELATVDGADLEDGARIDLITVLEHLKGAVAAAQARVTVAFADSQLAATADGTLRQRAQARRSVQAQVALARRVSPSLGDRYVGAARALVGEMPATMTRLTEGTIGEQAAVELVAATAGTTVEVRREADRRLAGPGGPAAQVGPRRLGQLGRAVVAELDAAGVVARNERAVASRRVTCRPAPDGMAYLTVLGPMHETVGAYAALKKHAATVMAGRDPAGELPVGRHGGAVMADTALRQLSGRELGQVQPVAVQLVMTDRALTGIGSPDRSVMEPARMVGHAPVPAPTARAWLRTHQARRDEARRDEARRNEARRNNDSHDNDSPRTLRWAVPASQQPDLSTPATPANVSTRAPDDRDWGTVREQAHVWVRRAFTEPSGRDLVALESKAALFPPALVDYLVLRDDVCATPWCGAPIAHADHITARHAGGSSTAANGQGLCAHCNLTKEAPGWHHEVTATGLHHPGEGPHAVRITPTGHTYHSGAPPLLGRNWQPPPHDTERRPGYGPDLCDPETGAPLDADWAEIARIQYDLFGPHGTAA